MVAYTGIAYAKRISDVQMRILGFSESAGALRVEPESFEDLYLLARIIGPADVAEAKSYRRFRPNESDEGERKEVFVRISVERVEVDKSAERLRLGGKILGGRPEAFIQINSYHTLNIAPYDHLEIKKGEWKSYILRRLKEAAEESKRPRLGIIAMDDEKATVAYVRGYGIDINSEIYSHLSKKMNEKEFERQRIRYFDEVIKACEGMEVEITIMAGPGFTKDDIKKYIGDKGIETGKRLVYASAGDAERSGVREVMQSEIAAKLIEGEHLKKEFGYLNLLFSSLRMGNAIYGAGAVSEAIDSRKAGVIIVNDSALVSEDIKAVLDAADRRGIRIEIFNAEDEAGAQLHSLRDIAAIERSILKQ